MASTSQSAAKRVGAPLDEEAIARVQKTVKEALMSPYPIVEHSLPQPSMNKGVEVRQGLLSKKVAHQLLMDAFLTNRSEVTRGLSARQAEGRQSPAGETERGWTVQERRRRQHRAHGAMNRASGSDVVRSV